jgi:hypothetical protein
MKVGTKRLRMGGSNARDNKVFGSNTNNGKRFYM